MGNNLKIVPWVTHDIPWGTSYIYRGSHVPHGTYILFPTVPIHVTHGTLTTVCKTVPWVTYDIPWVTSCMYCGEQLISNNWTALKRSELEYYAM